MVRQIKWFALVVSFLTVGVPSAHAVLLDLTGATTEGFINSALYSRTNKTGTGTGNVDAFVRINGGAIEEAYNTTVGGVFDNTNDATHNHAILLSAVPYVVIDNVAYREFLLDMGEPGNGDRFLSLDDIQIFVSGIANQSVEICNGGGSCPGLVDLDGLLVYRLDANADSRIRLDSTLGGGQGHDDMFAYIPDSFFPGSGSQYVYLYSRFGEAGGADANQGTFEEWAMRIVDNPPCEQTRTCHHGSPVIPEPVSILLFGSGLICTAGLGSVRKRF